MLLLILLILKLLSVKTVKKGIFFGSRESFTSSSVMRAPFSGKLKVVRAFNLFMRFSVDSFMVGRSRGRGIFEVAVKRKLMG